METQIKTKSTFRFFITIVSMLATCIILLFIIVIKLHRNNVFLQKEINNLDVRMESLTLSVNNTITHQSEEFKYLLNSENTLTRSTIDSLKDTTIKSQRTVQSNIHTLQNTYSSILNEESKHHVSDSEKDTAINDSLEEAKKLFSQNKYLEANKIFMKLLELQQDNKEIHFYAFYSLFLSNKMDSTQYRIIIDEFTKLENSGYARPEITETLRYINNENMQ